MIQKNDTTTRADYQHLKCNTKFEYTRRLTMYLFLAHQSQIFKPKIAQWK